MSSLIRSVSIQERDGKKTPRLNEKNKVADVWWVICHSTQTHKEEEIISFVIEEYKNIAHTFSILFTPVNTPT